MNQIIMNLVLNALFALKNGATSEPQISIKSYSDSGFGYIEVENNGPGIPKGLAETVFDPFVTTKPEGEGTGLGLSVARELANSFPSGSLTLSSLNPVIFLLRFAL
jgi:C4-dicarboxylate-specific signal transduction histidine kinase